MEKSKFEVLYNANKEELDRIRREREKKIHAILLIQRFFKNKKDRIKERYNSRINASILIIRIIRVYIFIIVIYFIETFE